MIYSGTFEVTTFRKYEVTTCELFTTFPQPNARGTVTLTHLDSSAIESWDYDITSNSLYVETRCDDWKVTLSPGRWSITHVRTQGNADLTIQATVTGSSAQDGAIITLAWLFGIILVLSGLCILAKYPEQITNPPLQLVSPIRRPHETVPEDVSNSYFQPSEAPLYCDICNDVGICGSCQGKGKIQGERICEMCDGTGKCLCQD